jgi:hypothetical protein
VTPSSNFQVPQSNELFIPLHEVVAVLSQFLESSYQMKLVGLSAIAKIAGLLHTTTSQAVIQLLILYIGSSVLKIKQQSAV